jgi:hypothetical protein
MSKFAQKISEAEDIAGTKTKHPSNINYGRLEEFQVQTALGLVGNVQRGACRPQTTKQFQQPQYEDA